MFDVQENVAVGDIVAFKAQPGDPKTSPGLVVFVGNESLEVLVFSYNGNGIKPEHRSGVRHVSDPIWLDPQRSSNLIEDDDSGCFDLGPQALKIKELTEQLDSARLGAALADKPKNKEVFDVAPAKKAKAAQPAPNLSFREPTKETAPELTEEQKAERLQALARNAGENS